jgi:hypothetical protein
MAYQALNLKFAGVSPLIHHRGGLANPLDPMAKEMKRVTAKRKKTDADFEQLAKLEFFGSLYLGEDGSPIIPADCIEACLIEGAKKIRRGPEAKSGVICMKHSQLEYDGPRTDKELWEDKRFVIAVGVRIQRNRIIRTRPMFPNWSADVHLEYEDSVLNASDVREFAVKAGQLVGLCDWRPRYGRFSVH